MAVAALLAYIPLVALACYFTTMPRRLALFSATVLLVLVGFWMAGRSRAEDARVALCEWLSSPRGDDGPRGFAALGSATAQKLREVKDVCGTRCRCRIGDAPHAESPFETAIIVSDAHRDLVGLRFDANWPGEARVLGYWSP